MTHLLRENHYTSARVFAASDALRADRLGTPTCRRCRPVKEERRGERHIAALQYRTILVGIARHCNAAMLTRSPSCHVVTMRRAAADHYGAASAAAFACYLNERTQNGHYYCQCR